MTLLEENGNVDLNKKKREVVRPPFNYMYNSKVEVIKDIGEQSAQRKLET